jgi:hypothetical protein
MSKLYEATFVDKATNKVLLHLKQKNPLNKYFWEKEKVMTVERLSRRHELPKSQIDIVNSTEWKYAE